MSKQLPKQPSLEHLKNEAKALLRLTRQGNPVARLAEAQLQTAREYGFPSWSELKRAVEGYAGQRDALFEAIRAGDRARVDALLTESPPLANALNPHSFGSSTMGAAAARNDRPMIELLLKHGADIDGRSDWWAGSFGALDFADEETSKFLLAKGATLTAHAAARLGMAKELKEIIRRKPDAVHERGGDGQYPLHFAKTVEIVDILLDAGAEIDARDIDHEGTPAQNRVLVPDVLNRLVERGAATDIFMAIALDDLNLVKKHLANDPQALERRTDQPGNPMIPQAPGHHIYTYNLGPVRPIQAAINLHRERIYDYLFEQSSPKLKLLSACLKGDRDVAIELVSSHPGLVEELSAENPPPLCASAKSADVQAVAVMLEVGFPVDAADGEKMTALHWAAFHGQDRIVETILPYNPPLEVRNVYGGTPLSNCVYGATYGWMKGNFPRCIDLLVAAGAKLPEHAYGPTEVVETLRRHGVK